MQSDVSNKCAENKGFNAPHKGTTHIKTHNGTFTYPLLGKFVTEM